MPSSENRVIIACAGSGKTTRLVNEALTDRSRRIAFVTYTNNNAKEIGKKFGDLNSGTPRHVDVLTWYSFLLRECARPYQRKKYSGDRIESILFVNQQSTRHVAEANTRDYYFANGKFIYSDKIAKFVVECEQKSSGAVTARLNEIYTDVYIDEFQDLAGWDLEIIDMLLRSKIRVTLVGDPRQHIYTTNPSQKNMKYRGENIVTLVDKWARNKLCATECMNETYRCSQEICDFSNVLWPDMGPMTSLRNITTAHEGVFLVGEDIVDEYIRRFRPQVLRYDNRANTYGHEALNFGQVKGLEFERVLIVPTNPIKEFLKSGEVQAVESSKTKLHVAVTRARNSVAFVSGNDSVLVPRRWSNTTPIHP